MNKSVMELRIKQWLPILEAQANSGLNKQDWCEQNGVNRNAFFRWQRKCQDYLLSKTKVAEDNTSFVEISCMQSNAEVQATSTNYISESSSMVISCNGFSITLTGQIDEDNLAKVLKVISYVQ